MKRKLIQSIVAKAIAGTIDITDAIDLLLELCECDCDDECIRETNIDGADVEVCCREHHEETNPKLY